MWLAGRSGYAREYRYKSLEHLGSPLLPSSNFPTIAILKKITFVSVLTIDFMGTFGLMQVHFYKILTFRPDCQIPELPLRIG